ncbi:roadblock/LC7 domain-containing protein [Thermomicrobiaceae bacterium CFH 74404]|uniref:Roadblock/LC7 domain-containing protein n=1 Tax=Thermalbibacter longus TaxID=2951981 RepID=A0AA41WBA3_9BACT|nr:roadblock/LC7 domain-containing protein [Thermalbibacter longus]MCM8749472.1 roadblock/LC7 domain-containing protein [Thermalbibacter longus]
MTPPLEELLEGVVARPGVVGAVVATLDGLVMGSLAMVDEDADAVGAVASLLARSLRSSGESSGMLAVSGGRVCVAAGEMLVVAALVEDEVDGQEVTAMLEPLVVEMEGWVRPPEG